jgi:hypothetical protein
MGATGLQPRPDFEPDGTGKFLTFVVPRQPAAILNALSAGFANLEKSLDLPQAGGLCGLHSPGCKAGVDLRAGDQGL